MTGDQKPAEDTGDSSSAVRLADAFAEYSTKVCESLTIMVQYNRANLDTMVANDNAIRAHLSAIARVVDECSTVSAADRQAVNVLRQERDKAEDRLTRILPRLSRYAQQVAGMQEAESAAKEKLEALEKDLSEAQIQCQVLDETASRASVERDEARQSAASAVGKLAEAEAELQSVKNDAGLALEDAYREVEASQSELSRMVAENNSLRKSMEVLLAGQAGTIGQTLAPNSSQRSSVPGLPAVSPSPASRSASTFASRTPETRPHALFPPTITPVPPSTPRNPPVTSSAVRQPSTALNNDAGFLSQETSTSSAGNPGHVGDAPTPTSALQHGPVAMLKNELQGARPLTAQSHMPRSPLGSGKLHRTY